MRRGRRPVTPPQERSLMEDDATLRRRELLRQFQEFVAGGDEPGYWLWLNLQPGFDPKSQESARRARQAWDDALAERRRVWRHR